MKLRAPHILAIGAIIVASAGAAMTARPPVDSAGSGEG